MNKLRLYTSLSFALLMSTMFGCVVEDETIDPSDIFIKYYGTRADEQLVDMLQMSDGGLLILGSTRNNDFGTRDFFVMRTDLSGNKLWQYQYNTDTIFDNDDQPASIRFNADSTKGIVIGTVNVDIPEEQSVFFAEFSLEDGTVDESASYVFQYYDGRGTNQELIGHKRTLGADILDLGDSYLILGSVYTGINRPLENTNLNILLTRVPKSQQPYPGPDTNADWEEIWDSIDGFDIGQDRAQKMVVSDAGEYFYVASSQPQSGQTKVFIAHYNLVSGVETAESRLYGSEDKNEFPTSMLFHRNHLVVTGTSRDASGQNAEPFFLRVHESLENERDIVTWSAFRQEVFESGEGFDIAAVPSNGIYPANYYITGLISPSTPLNNEKRNEVFVMGLDLEGNVLTEIEFFGSEGNDVGNAIEIAEDGSLLIGSTMDFAFESRVLSVIKRNSRGKLE